MAVHIGKQVMHVDAICIDACPMRVFSEGEYNVRTSNEIETVLLPFFSVCLCIAQVYWHLLWCAKMLDVRLEDVKTAPKNARKIWSGKRLQKCNHHRW